MRLARRLLYLGGRVAAGSKCEETGAGAAARPQRLVLNLSECSALKNVSHQERGHGFYIEWRRVKLDHVH